MKQPHARTFNRAILYTLAAVLGLLLLGAAADWNVMTVNQKAVGVATLFLIAGVVFLVAEADARGTDVYFQLRSTQHLIGYAFLLMGAVILLAAFFTV
jgi:ABC-type long-subunit fatty acid transport system fused permease/ATPase subunit